MTLPDSVRLGCVRLAVSSLQRSLQFYAGTIGFRVLSQSGPSLSAARAFLGVQGSEEVLLELEEQPGLKPLGKQKRLGLYHFAVLLPSREALGSFAGHLQKNGIAAGSADHLVSEAFYLVDPDGLSVEVYADRPRSTWQYRDSELLLATDSIKMDQLLRLGAVTSWSGLPAGTTQGHIHFYVDDLEHASEFYHSALGFQKTLWSLPSALFLSAGGYHHHVGVNTWAANSPRASQSDPRLLSWQLRLPNSQSLRSVAANLEGRGAVKPDASAFAFCDPWGNTVLLTSDTENL